MGGGAINTRQQDTTNLRLVYLFFEIGENNEFEEKTISHMCSYHDPTMGTEGLENKEGSSSRRHLG